MDPRTLRFLIAAVFLAGIIGGILHRRGRFSIRDMMYATAIVAIVTVTLIAAGWL